MWMISCFLSVGSKAHYISSIATRAEKKTAEYCKKLCTEAIIEAEETYSCKVASLITQTRLAWKGKLDDDLNERR